MFGFVVGTVCLVLLFVVLRRRRWYRANYGYGYGCGGYHGRRSYGPRAWLWGLLRRIDATPAQEKVFRDEVANLLETARGLKETFRASRGDLAGALRDEALDRTKLDALFRKQDELISALRTTLGESLGRVHATLDAGQRRELAALVERC